MTFQRARSDEQREIRREAILETAIAMLDETPVMELTLNELSRRVGLAKSNVLRYFESREAVLLELIDRFVEAWLSELDGDLDRSIDSSASPEERAHALAASLSASLANRKVLCDLLGAQGAVLERNVSADVARRHKQASMARLATMTATVRRHVPELGDGAEWFCLMALLTGGALSTYVPVPPSLQAVYAEDPALGRFNLDLAGALHMALDSVLTGVLPRSVAA
jgi:AcrR family transcriptional regulator